MTQRFRTRGAFEAAPTYTWWKLWESCSNSSWAVASTPSPGLKLGQVETMHDTVIPDFHARRERGEIFFNEMQQTRVVSLSPSAGNGPHVRKTATITCTGVPRNYEYRYDGGWFRHIVYLQEGSPSDGVPSPVKLLSSTDISDTTAEASTACLANRGMTDSNLFESVAEIRSTARLLRRPLQSLQRLIRKGETLRDRGVSAAGCWLQYRYGILPIVRDIGSVVNGMKQKVGNVRKTSRGFASNRRTATTSHVRGSSGVGEYITNYQKQTIDSVDARAMSLDEYTVSELQNIGFTTKGLLSLPWELIPYSFVADWFVNFGDLLKALVPLPGVRQLGSCVVTRRTSDTTWIPTGNTANAGWTLLRQPTGLVRVSSMSLIRTPQIQPSIVIRGDFRLDEVTRLADATALIMQKLDRVFT